MILILIYSFLRIKWNGIVKPSIIDLILTDSLGRKTKAKNNIMSSKKTIVTHGLDCRLCRYM